MICKSFSPALSLRIFWSSYHYFRQNYYKSLAWDNLIFLLISFRKKEGLFLISTYKHFYSVFMFWLNEDSIDHGCRNQSFRKQKWLQFENIGTKWEKGKLYAICYFDQAYILQELFVNIRQLTRLQNHLVTVWSLDQISACTQQINPSQLPHPGWYDSPLRQVERQ